MPKFDYKEQKSAIFGKIKRPLVTLELFSKVRNRWVKISNVLADTGADVSLLPRFQGEVLVKDITKGREVELRGIVPYARLTGFIHNLRLKINGIVFDAPVVIVDSDDTPPILGRSRGIDRFLAEFNKGKELKIE